MSKYLTYFYQRITGFFSTGVLLTAFAGCGGSQGIVRNLQLQTRNEGGNTFLETRAEVKIGNLKFPNFALPIVDPSQPGKSYGQIILQRTLDQKNILLANINLTEAAHVPGLADNRLPNGNPIPLSETENVIALRAGSNTKVYFGSAAGRSIFGVAVAISEFDAIARYVPGANLFFDLPVRNNITGLAGIFTSVNSGESGLALFIDATTQLPGLSIAKTQRNAAPQRVFVAGSNQSDRKTKELERRMYQMSQNSRTLRVK